MQSRHFCTTVHPKLQYRHIYEYLAYWTGTQTVIYCPTEVQKPEKLQKNLIPLFIVCLSLFSLTQKHKYLETLRQRHHRCDLMYWNVHFTSTENAGQYQSQKTDKPSNKDSILSGHIQTEKTQKQTATRHWHIRVNRDKATASNKWYITNLYLTNNPVSQIIEKLV